MCSVEFITSRAINRSPPVKKTTPPLDWTDIRYFAELCRSRSLSAAARRLGVTHATVGRRVTDLEDALGVALFTRRDGAFVLTAEGERVAALIAPIELQIESISRAGVEQSNEIVGPVRVTTTETFGTRFLVPRLKEFQDRFPNIETQLIFDQRNLSLARREADIAIRLAPPLANDVEGVNLGDLRYRFYAPAAQTPRAIDGRRIYIGYDETVSHTLEYQYFERTVGRDHYCQVRTNNQLARLAAVRAGFGIGLLPQYLGDAEEGIARIDFGGPGMSREIWLLVHKDLKAVPRIRVCCEFLQHLIENSRTILTGE